MIVVHVNIGGRDIEVSLSLDDAKELRRTLGKQIELAESNQEANPLRKL